MNVERRTVWAQNLTVLTHVEVNVRVVKRRTRPHAVELFDANENALSACVVREMGNKSTGHVRAFRLVIEYAGLKIPLKSAAR